MTPYCSIKISAPTEEEAHRISKSLIEQKLVAGTMIYNGNCHYWWDGKVVERMYWNIGAFSLMDKKDQIISEVRKLHSDTCPIIAFTEIDGNEEFLQWITESVKEA